MCPPEWAECRKSRPSTCLPLEARKRAGSMQQEEQEADWSPPRGPNAGPLSPAGTLAMGLGLPQGPEVGPSNAHLWLMWSQHNLAGPQCPLQGQTVTRLKQRRSTVETLGSLELEPGTPPLSYTIPERSVGQTLETAGCWGLRCGVGALGSPITQPPMPSFLPSVCLLYTSDAADDL